MELQFTQNGKDWIAETTVNAPYHLHLERKEGSSKFMIYQRGTDSGQYANCVIGPYLAQNQGQVIDWSFDHTIYPMHVRFESGSEVTSATLTEAEQ